MDFNPANPWQDTSGQGATVGCLTGYCPSVSSGSASFNGAQYPDGIGRHSEPEQRAPDPECVDLSADQDAVKDGWYQGILGYHSHLGRRDRRTPPSSAMASSCASASAQARPGRAHDYGSNVLTANAWNHVVATYSQDDGYARIYVNGVRRAEQQRGEVRHHCVAGDLRHRPLDQTRPS